LRSRFRQSGAKWQDKHKLAILAWDIRCMRIISKQLVAAAIDNPDLRKAVRIMDNIREARELMDELPPPVLEVLRDTFKRLATGRTGPYGDLKAAWLHYAQQALDDARVRERQETFGTYQNDVGPKGPRRR
jgi:hypothetical protein